MLRLISVSFLLAALAASAASAQVPRTISYQGVLDDGGAPVTSATALTFRLYATPSGGTERWTETQTVTPDADGVFSARLGVATPLRETFRAQMWLEVAAGETVLGPRTPLDAVPYALALYGIQVIPPEFSAQGPGIAAGHPSNSASGEAAVVSGGGTASTPNRAPGDYAAVGGGDDNTAFGPYSTIGGGRDNFTTQATATDGGGNNATIGGGFGNLASRGNATVGGGRDNIARAGSATVGGGIRNEASGETGTIGGGRDNSVAGYGATVGGGQSNAATFDYSTVGGGLTNTAGETYATVGGGRDNTARAFNATVGGGQSNTARAPDATVGGGRDNTARGGAATVPGGLGNHARGGYGFAAGYFARAVHNGAFVWSDNSRSVRDSLVSTADHQFLVRAAGGVGIGTNAPGAQVHVETASSGSRPHLLLDETNTGGFARLRMANANAAGAYWDLAAGGSGGDAFNFFYWDGASGSNLVGVNAPGAGLPLISTASGASLTQGGTWANASSRALKTDFLAVDPEAVLATLADIPVTRWRYRAEADDVWHLGPVSQDFHAAFGLGATDEAIGTVDADGVALVSIQALHARTEAQADEIAAQATRIEALTDRLDAQQAQIDALMRRLDALALSTCSALASR